MYHNSPLHLPIKHLPATLDTSDDFLHPWSLDITLSCILSVSAFSSLHHPYMMIFKSVSSVWISLKVQVLAASWTHTAPRYLTGASNSMCPKSNSANLLCLHCVQLTRQLCTPRKAFLESAGSSNTVFPLFWYQGLPFECSEILLSQSHLEWATTFDSIGNPSMGRQRLPVAKILVTNELLQNILKLET